MPGQATVTIGENSWTVSVATTYAELVQGLSGVLSMPAGTGMLFILPAEQAVSVDTTGMNFPIDIIFISNNTVIDIARNIQPGYLVTEETPCDSFLEVNAGEADDIESGDMVGMTIYQPAATTMTNWILPLVSFAGFMAVGAFITITVRNITRAILVEPSERLKLLPQIEGKLTRDDVTIDSWVERDRIGIWVTNNRTGETVAEWWNAGARDMFEDGFFKEADYIRHQKLIGRDFEESVKDYLEGLDVLASAGVEYLPQAKTTELNGLRITKAYKQISRHGENEISVSLLAWGVFPKGRRPHMISMYRSGQEYVINPLYAHISEWVHVPVEKVKAWIRSLPVRHFEPMAVAPELREEAERLAREVDEPMDIVSLPSRKPVASVIPVERRPRRETDLEYLADTPEYLTQTIDATGYRDKLDATFQEAIARAKGLK